MTTKTVGTVRSLSEESRLAKNAAIAASQKATKERRRSQTCAVFELKIQTNKLSARQREALFMAFTEAKWLYNHCLSSGDVFNYRPGGSVVVKTKDGTLEEREFRFLGSQMKQSVIEGMKSSIKTLASLKKKGKSVGRLKYVSDYHSLNLKQFGGTYRFRGSKVRVQNIPGWMRVLGTNQLEEYEIANARLVKKPKGYYLKVTAFKDKGADNLVASQISHHGSVVGIDMGVTTHITVSDGRKINVLVGETDRLKRLQRRLSRQVAGSDNYERTRSEIRRQYQRMDHLKNDAAVKTVRDLTSRSVVVFQDENIQGWKKGTGYVRAGKRLQHSILGRAKQRLRNHPKAVMLGRFEPTTQLCVCGIKTPHALDQRTFVCSACGVSEDRDVHAAKMMIHIAAKKGLLPELSASGAGTSKGAVPPTQTITSGPEGINACGDQSKTSQTLRGEPRIGR